VPPPQIACRIPTTAPPPSDIRGQVERPRCPAAVGLLRCQGKRRKFPANRSRARAQASFRPAAVGLCFIFADTGKPEPRGRVHVSTSSSASSSRTRASRSRGDRDICSGRQMLCSSSANILFFLTCAGYLFCLSGFMASITI
jgi:hypothetical protein